MNRSLDSNGHQYVILEGEYCLFTFLKKKKKHNTCCRTLVQDILFWKYYFFSPFDAGEPVTIAQDMFFDCFVCNQSVCSIMLTCVCSLIHVVKRIGDYACLPSDPPCTYLLFASEQSSQLTRQNRAGLFCCREFQQGEHLLCALCSQSGWGPDIVFVGD